jgi:probable addiction module antidote protein
MARDIGSTAVRKARLTSSSLSAGQRKNSSKTSKKRNGTGRITKKEAPAALPLERWIQADLRKDKEQALVLLAESFHDEHEGTFLVALRHMILAQAGMAGIAKAAGLNRESLYKALSHGGNPGVNTLRKILAALKIKVAFVKA